MVYQLFGQAVARLQYRFAQERTIPLEEGRVYYLPYEVFSGAKLSLAPVTTGSPTLLSTVLNPVTLRCLLQKLEGPSAWVLAPVTSGLVFLADVRE